jgi:hypothetical protein
MGKSTPTNPSQANCFEGGKQEHDDDAVEVRTGVTYSQLSAPVPSNVQACKDASRTPTGYTDGIAITVKCKKNPHLLQFIYREIIGADGKAVSRPITTTGGTYNTTTDPANPNWNTDSSGKPNAYYEAGFLHRSDSDSLTTFDQPGLMPGAGETWRTTFKAYSVCDGKVTREITWVREQTDGSAPKYTVKVEKANALPDWAKKKMKDQGYDAAP